MAYKIDDEKCIACGACVASCPIGCIKLADKAEIDQTMCVSCGTCEGVCPVGAPKAE